MIIIVIRLKSSSSALMTLTVSPQQPLFSHSLLCFLHRHLSYDSTISLVLSSLFVSDVKAVNRLFLNDLKPLPQSESCCPTFHMKVLCKAHSFWPNGWNIRLMKGLFPKRLELTKLSTFLWTFFTSKVYTKCYTASLFICKAHERLTGR